MRNRFAFPWLAILALLGMSQIATAQDPLPADAKPLCTVTKMEFAKWYANGMIQKDGLVDPDDSVNFVSSGDCAFYKWSWQMFLWITSPQHIYGGNSLVLDSPIFYDVSAPDAQNKRKFIANAGLGIKNFSQFRAQKNSAGKFLRINKAGILEETEEGQATGDTLMAQTGSLVYYGIHANDVYAYFLTGNENGEIKPKQTHFPASKAELDLVVAFAAKHKKKIPDANALAMELKTSWVEVDKLPNANTYVQITANVPTYTKTATKWTPTGKTKQAKLALVGMHVVGTAKGHPEMIWATFEHMGNAPNGAYTYTDKGGATKNVKQITAGNWLFCKSKSAGPFNKSHMHASGATIEAAPGFTISPSDTLREGPWGENFTMPGAGTTNNTEIISINNSVLSLIPAGDVRKNYGLIGATWTTGALPVNPAQAKGSLKLANATMETYSQNSNCFTCHQGGNLTGLSHIYGGLVPLFKALPIKIK